mgnify:CR=1 FL=1
MEIFIGSYGYRWNDAMGTAIGLTRSAVEEAIDKSCEWEKTEMPGYCEREHDDDPEEDCVFCNPDLVTYGVRPLYHCSELGGLRNTINYVKNAKENGVAWMEF